MMQFNRAIYLQIQIAQITVLENIQSYTLIMLFDESLHTLQ